MRLLLIDNHSSSLESGGLLLRSAGHRVEQALTGWGAVKLLLCTKYDLVLIHFRLPDISGLEVVRTVRKHGIELRWILFSGFMDFEVARETGRLGAMRTLSVPIDLEAIVSEASTSSSALGDDGWWKSSLPPS